MGLRYRTLGVVSASYLLSILSPGGIVWEHFKQCAEFFSRGPAKFAEFLLTNGK